MSNEKKPSITEIKALADFRTIKEPHNCANCGYQMFGYCNRVEKREFIIRNTEIHVCNRWKRD